MDWKTASEVQKKQLRQLTIHKGWILITDSGTLGRVIYAREEHEGVIATNNLIRVVIEDEALRGYVYNFLTSELGQHQMLKHAYGTNQLHIEPWHVADVLIPVPKKPEIYEDIGKKVLKSMDYLEKSRELEKAMQTKLTSLFGL